MERPAQRYFCNKCGYVGNVDLHPGCGYLAYHLAPFEQNYIDQLEKELADIKKLATSRAGGQAMRKEMTVVDKLQRTFNNLPQEKKDRINRILENYEETVFSTPHEPNNEDRLEQEITTLREQVEKLTKERDEWKSGFEAAASKYRNLKLQMQEIINVC